jgi:hypothetical protein
MRAGAEGDLNSYSYPDSYPDPYANLGDADAYLNA